MHPFASSSTISWSDAWKSFSIHDLSFFMTLKRKNRFLDGYEDVLLEHLWFHSPMNFNFCSRELLLKSIQIAFANQIQRRLKKIDTTLHFWNQNIRSLLEVLCHVPSPGVADLENCSCTNTCLHLNWFGIDRGETNQNCSEKVQHLHTTLSHLDF